MTVNYHSRSENLAFSKNETVGASGVVEFSLPGLPLEVKSMSLRVSRISWNLEVRTLKYVAIQQGVYIFVFVAGKSSCSYVRPLR